MSPDFKNCHLVFQESHVADRLLCPGLRVLQLVSNIQMLTFWPDQTQHHRQEYQPMEQAKRNNQKEHLHQREFETLSKSQNGNESWVFCQRNCINKSNKQNKPTPCCDYLIVILRQLVLLILIFVFFSCFITNPKWEIWKKHGRASCGQTFTIFRQTDTILPSRCW